MIFNRFGFACFFIWLLFIGEVYAQTQYRTSQWQDRDVTGYVQREFVDQRSASNRFDNSQTRTNRQSSRAHNYNHEYMAPAHNMIDPRLPAPHNSFFEQNTALEKFSALEEMYSERVVDELKQFGYDLFGVPTRHIASRLEEAADESFSMPSGSVQDNFTLNIGDQLEVVFTGQRNDRDIYNINNQGMLLIEDFPPIPAAGRSIGQVRISIEAAARNFHNTRPYVSLASVRQIGVLVVGHVKRPGRQNLTVFHTVLDALMETGGIEKTGSLRQIKLVRDGRSQLIDIYSLLLHGATNADLQLQDGDRLIVPPIGPTIAVSGEVKRPGIYELLPRIKGMRHKPENIAQKLSLNEVLEMAGGVLVSGQNRFMKLSVTRDGREQVAEIKDPFQQVFSDGSILSVSKGREKRSGVVELTGHTRNPRIYAIDKLPNLSTLLSSDNVLGEDIYPLIGLIERWNPRQLTTTLIEFPLQLVMMGDYDRKLHEDDVVHLFSNKQIQALQKTKSHQSDEQDSLDAPDNERYDDSMVHQISMNSDLREYGSRLQETELIEDPTIQSFLKERAVFVRGAVRKSGEYPIAEGVTLDNILAVSGGLALEANISNIEVTSSLQGTDIRKGQKTTLRRIRVNLQETNPEDILIGLGDSIRVNQKFDKIEDKSVLILGEVKNPGRYDLVPGDKVSDLLKRAGGITRDAYPEGAIFSRQSERKAEEQRYRALARNIERDLAAALEKMTSNHPMRHKLPKRGALHKN